MPERLPGGRSTRLEGLSPEQRARLIEELRRERLSRAGGTAIPRRPAGVTPLSLPQQRLWFLERLANGASGYHIPAAWQLTGRLDRGALARSLAEIERRHEALRTTFGMSGERPVQVVAPPRPPALPLADLGGLPAAGEEALRLAGGEAQRAFDLERGPLWRALLIRTAAEEHVLLLVLHHIVADGWSMGVLFAELSALYAAFAAGRPSPLPEPPVQYGDFAAWQRRRWDEGELAPQLAWWKERLAGLPQVLELPADRPRPAVQTQRGGVLPVSLTAGAWQPCEALGRRLGATPFMVCLAAFAALLGRLSGQEDLAVGSPAANRQPAETGGLIGFFVNTLVLRAELAGNPSFAELLGRVRETVLAAHAHGEVPFEKLVEELRPQRDLSHQPIVQAIFAFEDAAAAPPPLAGLRVDRFPLGAAVAPFDLALNLAGAEGGLRGWWVYGADLFDATTVRRWAEAWERLLGAVAGRPDLRLSELPVLSAAERHQALAEWNDTGEAPAGLERFYDLFAAWARRSPEAPALLSETEEISYAELDRRAGRLAARLRSLGVGPEVLVGVCLESSPEAVISLFAVLRAGGVYLPLDAGYPAERLAYMLEDSGAALVVTRRDLADRLPAGGPAHLFLDFLDDGEAPPAGEAAPWPAPPAEAAAYAIYTSGSTGRPKGTVISQRSFAGLPFRQSRVFGRGPGDRILMFSSLSFDASVLEVAFALGSGAALVVAGREARMPGPALARLLAERRVTMLVAPPSALAALPPATLPDLRILVSAGEALLPDLIDRWAPGRWFFDGYGPTETTVWATCGRCRAGEPRPGIGRPSPGVRVHLLGPRLEIAPIGVPGELYVGGEWVGRGYLGRPDLTAGRFVPDPWSGRPGARLYRTGDLARRRPDGNVEFLGRVDHQVKVRGFRIEPGEIEAALRRHSAVREAVVAVHADMPGSPGLVAWVVPRDGASEAESPEMLVQALRSTLRESLPEHMVPAAFVTLERLPLLPNGKVDHKALPAPAARRGETFGMAPRDEVERTLAAAWSAVLGLERVGIDESFFDLGGHSLLLVTLHGRLAERFPGLAVIDLFKYPTVRSLARHLRPEPEDEKRSGTAAPVPAREPAAGGAIAIVGMAGRFPGAGDVEAFWRNLCDGVESISFFTREELRGEGVRPALLEDPSYVPANGVLEGADLFDAGFFGVTPREAEVMDPQHRLLLETAWEALEDAGCDPDRAGRAGVFAGVSANTYLSTHVAAHPEALAAVGPFQAAISNQDAFAVSRISYKLDLRGPSVHVQTACSTSLVAVHLACRSLLAGECDLALAGGAGVGFPQRAGYLYQERGIASPDGHCRAFDARAAGTVGGNGVGLVLLKRLADALDDGDRIRAVIRGTAINNDGAGKVGYTAPGIDGQAGVIAAALAAAGVEPETIGYVEAHGSGTALGDPIEVAALTQAFRAGGGKVTGSCALGSVKTNIGHLDAAAGIAGLIKAALAVERGVQPPSLHFERPNPAIDFAAGPFFVRAEAAPWPPGSVPRRAGVSSFGMGGTNAHAVLEEPPVQPPRPCSRDWHLLVLSARSEPALEAATARLAQHLDAHPELDPADVAYTLQVGRKAFAHRRILVGRDVADLAGALARPDSGRAVTTAGALQGRPVALLFPGLGDVRPGMFRDLWRSETRFREEVERCAALLPGPLGPRILELFAGQDGAEPEPPSGIDLRRLARPGATGSRDDWWSRTEVAQPALFIAEHALARLWMSWEVKVAALLGYSLGEYVAACLAGILTLEDALPLVAGRARLLAGLPAGAMLAVPLAEERALALPEVASGAVALAAINGPEVSVLSGDPDAVAAVERRLAGEGVPCQRLATTQAFHSPAVEAIREPFLELLRGVELKPPRLPMLSGVTGRWITAAEATDPEYWYAHMRRTVRLADGLGELLRGPDCVLLETGPGQALSTLARQHPERTAGRAIVASAPHRHGRGSDAAFLLEALGRLWLAGVEVDWQRFHAADPRRKVPLPTYPFERRRYWLEPRRTAVREEQPAPAGRQDLADWFYAPAWKPAPRLGRAADAPVRWLVLGEAGGLGPALARELRRRGCEVVSESCARAKRDHASLLSHLRDEGRLPEGIAWLGEAGPDGVPEPERPEAGLLDLLALVQAIGELRTSSTLTLAVVTAGARAVTGEERLAPQRAALAGACRVIPLEYAGLSCRSIDLPLAWKAEGLAGPLAEELLAGPSTGAVAWRGGRRWVEGFERVRLEPPRELPLRERGVYLVTGGLGGIGLSLAGFLARQVRARLVLVGRTPPPSRDHPVLRRIAEMEESGSEVLALPADVADAGRMLEVLEEARRRFGEIDGVIHSAGVPGGGLIQLRTPEAVAAVFAPKVRGAFVLAELLRGHRLDFLAVCSSLSSVLGGVGQADYCAANAVLDSFASWHAAETGTPTVSVGWDTWKDTGMALAGVPEDEAAELLAGELRDKLVSAEGVEAFRRLLAAGLPHVLVSTQDLAVAMATVREVRLAEAAAQTRPGEPSRRAVHPRPALSRPYVPPRGVTERRLAALWEEVLGVDGVGVHDELTELGGHSLLALQLLWRVRGEFGVDVPIGALFEAPTVAAMAEALAAAREEREPTRRGPASPLVPLQPSGSRPPLFLVHPAGGGVSGYRDLARRLGPERPVWGLQAPGLADGGEPLADVQALAARYVDAVRSVAPAGPYLLGAWSLGALVAYEMAQQLLARGEEVGLLALFDAHVPVPGSDGLEGSDDPALLADLLHMEPEAGATVESVLAAARRAGRIGEDFGTAEAGRLLRVFKANVSAVHAYRPQPWPGRITLLRCREALPSAPPEPTLGWGALAAGGVEVCYVPGGHGDLVFEPHAAALAERLREALASPEPFFQSSGSPPVSLRKASM